MSSLRAMGTALVTVILFCGIGVAVEGSGQVTGSVKDAKCINRICHTGYEGISCFDDDLDGYCDR